MAAQRLPRALRLALTSVSSNGIAGAKCYRPGLSSCSICKKDLNLGSQCYSSRQRTRPSGPTPVAPLLPTLNELRAEIEKPGSPYIGAAPEDYYKALKEYEEAVVTHGAGRWWAATFPSRKGRPSLKLIHQLACIIRDTVPVSHNYWTGMWGWASEQGYTPSTIQLVSSMNTLRGFNVESWNNRPEFVKRAEIKFRQLAKVGNDPNVLTVQAEMLRTTGKTQASVDMLDRALKIGGDGFELFPRAKIALATALNDLGSGSEARSVLESINHLELAESNLQMGRALTEENPVAAREWFYKASLLGMDEGLEGLIKMEDRVIESTTDAEVAKRHTLMRREWEKMAKPGL